MKPRSYQRSSGLRVVAISALAATFATQAAAPDPVAELQKGQPKAVADLIERIVGCNHWMGEEPYDAERAKEIERAIAQLRCAELDADEAAIRRGNNHKAGEAIDAAKKIYL